VGELLCCGGSDGETRGWSLPPRSLGSLDGTSKGTRGVTLSWSVTVIFWTRRLSTLLACLDDLPLTFSYIQAPLQLLAHSRVLGVEARR
jgi:hypothetical protein